MNKLISHIIDKYALYSYLNKKSVQSQFFFDDSLSVSLENNKPLTLDYKSYKEKSNYETGSIEFSSSIEKFKINCFKNKENHNMNIIFVHGWKSDNFKKLNNIFFDYFKTKNYNMYYYVLPHHMNRKDDSSIHSGEFFLSSNINRTFESVLDSVNELSKLITHIKSTSKEKIVLIGFSMGGLISNLLSTIDNRIDYLIPLFYVNNLSYLTFNSVICREIKKDFIKNNITKDILSNVWNILTPSNYKPNVSKNHILLIYGKYDLYVPYEDSKKLWVSWDKPKKIIYGCGHSGIVTKKKEILRDINDFIEKE